MRDEISYADALHSKNSSPCLIAYTKHQNEGMRVLYKWFCCIVCKGETSCKHVLDEDIVRPLLAMKK